MNYFWQETHPVRNFSLSLGIQLCLESILGQTICKVPVINHRYFTHPSSHPAPKSPEVGSGRKKQIPIEVLVFWDDKSTPPNFLGGGGRAEKLRSCGTASLFTHGMAPALCRLEQLWSNEHTKSLYAEIEHWSIYVSFTCYSDITILSLSLSGHVFFF